MIEAKLGSSEITRAWLPRVLAGVCILCILGWLISREATAWVRFDWAVFYANVRYVSTLHTLIAFALIYGSFFLRAARWRVFLQPTKQVPTTRLFSATLVGFTGLALLGRPGELVRPYLIARREDLSFSSQIAVLALERIFDIAAAGLLIGIAISSSSGLQSLPYLAQFRHASLLLLAALIAAAIFTVLLTTNGQKLGAVLQQTLTPLSDRLARRIGDTISGFCSDLNRIRDPRSLVFISVLSILIWLAIGLAHFECIHAFGQLQHLSVADAFLLLGFSLLGSMVQLPGGGAQQIAFVAALIHVFGVPVELAASCAILGWLVLFMAPVPAGLALLRRQRLSLQQFGRSTSTYVSA
jgi:glycosyltransferase 2 family protein